MPDEDDTAELPVLREPPSWRKRAPALVALTLLFVGFTGYALFYRPAAARAAAVAELRTALTNIGAGNVVVAIGRDGRLQLSGSVLGDEQHAAVLAAVRARPQYVKAVDGIKVMPTANDLERSVAKELESRWQSRFSISVGPDFEAKLLGSADSEAQRNEALAFVGAQPGIERVKDATSKSLDWRRKELQQFITARKWRFVRGTVRDDGAIMLTGVVASAKDRALVIGATREAFPGAAIQADMVIWVSKR